MNNEEEINHSWIPDLTDEELREMDEAHYAENLCNAVNWFEHSRALIATARITREKSEKLINFPEKRALENVCTLLYGLALENIFKAHWIFKKYGAPHNPNWTPECKFPQEIKTHNLKKLAALISLENSKKYEYTLDFLTSSATWSGRYPCSLEPNDKGLFHLPETFDEAEAIYREMKEIFTISN